MASAKFSLSDWRRLFKQSAIPDDLADSYIAYVKRQMRRGVPVIFDFGHLSALLGRTRRYLASAVNSNQDHYRKFTISKRNGGKREILAPYPALAECQRWINANILSKARIHSAAHGFCQNRSIQTNAALHTNSEAILKIDLRDFFPSIGLPRVIVVFQQLGYPDNVSFYLASLATFDSSLPQGAPTSPAISNAVAFKLDCRLSALSSRLNLKYSRYADDLTFSGDRISGWTIECIHKIVNDEGFSVQDAKTRLKFGNSRKIVTGLVVTDRVRVPRQYRRAVRRDAHFVIKFGYFSHVANRRIRDPFAIEVLLGKLNFWRSIEPDCKFAVDAIHKIRAIAEQLKVD